MISSQSHGQVLGRRSLFLHPVLHSTPSQIVFPSILQNLKSLAYRNVQLVLSQPIQVRRRRETANLREVRQAAALGGAVITVVQMKVSRSSKISSVAGSGTAGGGREIQ